MSTSRHDPRNRQAARNSRGSVAPKNKSVYLRRRIIALVVLAALVALVWSLVAAAVGLVQNMFGGGNNAPTGTTGTTAIAACAADSIA